MKTFARIVMIFIGLILIGSALFLLGLNYSLIPGIDVVLPVWAEDTVMLVTAAVLLLIALILISLGLRSPKKVRTAALKGSETGEVVISITALENMVLRVMQQTQGIKDSGRQVVNTKDGLIVSVRMKVMPDISLPGLVDELQKNIKEYLEDITGIKVKEVKIIVENVIPEQAVSKK